LRKILFGSTGKYVEGEGNAPAETEQPRRSLRDSSPKKEEDVPPVSSLRQKPRLTPAEDSKDKCEFGAQYGIDYGKYGECEKCEKAQPCAEAADRKDAEAKEKASAPAVPSATPARRTLLRRGQ
jgi:hypothetical protein